MALACAAKEYLRRISIIWSSPLSDWNRVQETNQYALPVLRYLMWTQHWTLLELREVDRAARKIIVENGGKHPSSPTSLLYLPKEKWGIVNPVCVTTEGKVPVTAARARNLLRNSQEMQFLCGKECCSVSDWKMRA